MSFAEWVSIGLQSVAAGLAAAAFYLAMRSWHVD